MAVFSSQPERVDRISRLRPGQQEDLFAQQQAAIAGEGAGGAFGDAADYYRRLSSGEGDAEFEAPLQRQFKEDIIPGLSEQFAGLGSGGLSSSGFTQELGRASTDLSERLGAMRANLRQRGAEGLQRLGEGGLQQVDDAVIRPREPGLAETFLGNAATGVGQGFGTASGGPYAAALNGISSMFNKSGASGGGDSADPQSGGTFMDMLNKFLKR